MPRLTPWLLNFQELKNKTYKGELDFLITHPFNKLSLCLTI